MRQALRLAVLLVAFCACVGYTALGFFEVQTHFIDTTANEPAPVFTAAAVSDNTVPAVGELDGSGTTAVAATPDARSEQHSDSGTVLVRTELRPAEQRLARGEVTVHSDGQQRVLRLETDFRLENGPDLHVLIGNPQTGWGDPTGWIDLGKLKGNIGAQNYPIPQLHPITNIPVEFTTFTTLAIRSIRFDETYAVAYLAG